MIPKLVGLDNLQRAHSVTQALSGMVGIKPGTLELVPGGFEAEARQTMTNIK